MLTSIATYTGIELKKTSPVEQRGYAAQRRSRPSALSSESGKAPRAAEAQGGGTIQHASRTRQGCGPETARPSPITQPFPRALPPQRENPRSQVTEIWPLLQQKKEVYLSRRVGVSPPAHYTLQTLKLGRHTALFLGIARVRRAHTPPHDRALAPHLRPTRHAPAPWGPRGGHHPAY